jgi:hypothetical protein
MCEKARGAASFKNRGQFSVNPIGVYLKPGVIFAIK